MKGDHGGHQGSQWEGSVVNRIITATRRGKLGEGRPTQNGEERGKEKAEQQRHETNTISQKTKTKHKERMFDK